MQRNTNTTTNILLAIIAIALVIVIIVVLKKDKKEILVEETNIPTQEVVPEIEVPTTSTPKLVTPPAPGIFSESSVKDFNSSYNSATRTFTITAQVAKGFFFEGNSPVALYDQDGNLIEMKGAMTTADTYQQVGDYVPFTFTFTLPLTESPNQQFVVRIIQDNPSGNTPLYWGTVIGTK